MNLLKPRIDWLLIFLPITLAMEFVPPLHHQTGLFICSCLALIPLAGWMGKATEHLAERCGPTLGGLLNATFGNAAELIIALIALHKGMIEVVKASITGSIVGNLLLVLGLSMLAGGVRFKVQYFNGTQARAAATAMIISSVALFLPTVYHYMAERMGGFDLHVEENLSVAIAAVILFTYASHLVFSLKTHRHVPVEGHHGKSPAKKEENEEEKDGLHGPVWSLQKAGVVLLVSTVLVALLSEMMVGSLEAAKESFGFTDMFLGVFVIAIVGNAAEHSASVLMALKNKMQISIEIAVGSSLQVAMLIAPLLVFASHLFGHPITLEFAIPEVVAVFASVWIISHVCGDGESNWVEGLQLLALYAVLGALFYFLPGETSSVAGH